MSYQQIQYEEIMRRPESGWAKYGNSSNFSKAISHLMNNQWIPSIVSLNRAIKELGLRRIDGKTATDDQREAEQVAQKRINDAVVNAQSIPLTQNELDEFSSLGPRELSSRYESDIWFHTRYDLAIRTWGFRPPLRFAAPTGDEDGEVLELTPSQYRAIPAQVTTRRYMTEPAFKRAVDALIKAGLIVLTFFITAHVGVV